MLGYDSVGPILRGRSCSQWETTAGDYVAADKVRKDLWQKRMLSFSVEKV